MVVQTSIDNMSKKGQAHVACESRALLVVRSYVHDAQGVRSYIKLGLPEHLVQELNVDNKQYGLGAIMNVIHEAVCRLLYSGTVYG